MKISDVTKHKSVSALAVKESAKPPREAQSDFALKLNKLDGDALHEKLTSLLSDISDQSREVEKRFDLGEVMKYKKLVKEFLHLAVNNSHKFSKENFLDRRGRHRVLSIVRQVDGELEGLTQDFLKNEKDKLKIINKLDGIRGMLLDIFL